MFERVIADGVRTSAVWTALGEVYGRLLETDLARDAFRQAEELDPEDANLFRARAEWLAGQGLSKEAAADRARLDAVLRNDNTKDRPGETAADGASEAA
jgi:cytochrome c-type biogenesis protein CcmH/NrfG